MPESPALANYVILQNGATGTGNGTAIDTTTAATNEAYLGLTVQVSGISGDTITWEATIDGTNWIAVQFENLNSGVKATTTTANGLYRAAVLGLAQVRARVSTYGAGTIYVRGYLTA